MFASEVDQVSHLKDNQERHIVENHYRNSKLFNLNGRIKPHHAITKDDKNL
jgi:hypothetical protein